MRSTGECEKNFPQGLKPIDQLADFMYGLKPVPFKPRPFKLVEYSAMQCAERSELGESLDTKSGLGQSCMHAGRRG